MEESNHSTKLPHETGTENSVQSRESYQCDQCDLKASCKVSLRKHIGKTHNVIPQLDGLLEDEKFEDKEVQTEPELHEEKLKCPNFEYGNCDQEWFDTKFEWKEHRLKVHISDEIIMAKRHFQFVLQGLQNKSYLSARHDPEVVSFLESRLQDYKKQKKV